MARKRAAESDAERSDTPPKRARVDAVNGVKGKGKAKNGKEIRKRTPVEDSDNESVIEVSNPNEENDPEDDRIRVAAIQTDAEFERIHAESVKEAIARGNKSTGAAESGVISAVEMHNFMCHKFLSFKFGPQVNFIIGHNGSGKSAALSAITVALGGKATSTGRASGLKHFIRTGASAAEVNVTIKNGGHEPYKPEIFGDAITVTRSFTAAGNTSFKIKSKEGRVISTKRDELSSILDHFSIDVDNPMNILTQDLARQFLSASNGSDKYNLFLKGTLLTQLKEEYDQILENSNRTKAMISQKEIVVKELQEKFREVETRYNKAKNLQEAESQMVKLKAEMAWAHINDKERDVGKAVRAAEEARVKRDQYRTKVEETQAKEAECAEKVEEVERRAAQAAAPDELNAELATITRESNARAQEIMTAKRDLRELAQQIKTARKNLADTEREIADAEASLARDERREATRARVEATKAAHVEAEQRHKDAQAELGNKREAHESYQNQQRTVEREYHDQRERVTNAEETVKRLRENLRGEGGVALYGSGIARAVGIINNTRWTGPKPIGPLGLHVKLRDPKWAHVMRVGLGRDLGAFAVTNNADFQTLRKILNDNGSSNTQIIIAQPDIFDYSGGEPPQHVLTVLRALKIDDEWVTRILINSSKIERVLLADTRRDAERLLDTFPRSNVWTEQADRVQRFNDGGGQTSSLGAIRNGQDYRRLLFSAERGMQDVQDAEREFQSLVESFRATQSRKQEVDANVQSALAELQAARRVEGQARTAAKATNQAAQSALAEDVQEDPIDIAVLRNGLEGIRNRLEQYESGLQDGSSNVAKLEDENKPLLEQAEALRKQLKNYGERQKELKLEADETVAELMKIQNNVQHYQRKLMELDVAVLTAENLQRTHEQEYVEWRQNVVDRYEEVETRRTVQAIQKELEQKEAAHQRSLAEQGQSIEEILVDLERSHEAWRKAKKEFQDMTNFVTLLRRALMKRMDRWHVFRQFITLRIKMQFQYHLSHRGFFGQVIVNHDDGTLNLKVQTEDQGNKSGKAREKDAKSMSGGEKSFATICLLLSLWDAMGCPIRALDEFDVYMDAVNRRISMKMMLDAAKNADKQHILITPQDMGNVTLGPEVRVHRMRDPERGQQTLAL